MQSMLIADQMLARRGALKALGGLALGGAALAAGASGAASAPLARSVSDAPVSPEQGLHAFGKIWSSYDAPAIGAFHGTMYLRVGDRAAVPVFGMTGTGASQAKIDKDGNLILKSRETTYFTDLATGDILETWLNPFTEERVDVYHFYDDLLMGRTSAKDTPSMISFQPLGAQEMMMSWDYAKAYDNPVTPEGWPSYSTGHRISPSEHFTFYMSKAEYLDSGVSSVRTRGSFARMSQCWPFMKMGKSPMKDAVLFGRMFTHKGLPGFGEVPSKVLAYVEKHAPQYLEPPPGWGAPGEAHMARLDTWKAFAGDIPPETPGYPWTQQPMTPGLAPPTGLAALYRKS
jgi:hypothetical protein